MKKTVNVKVLEFLSDNPLNFSFYENPTDPALKRFKGSFFLLGTFSDEVSPELKKEIVKKLRDGFFSAQGSILTVLQALVEEKIGEIKDLVLVSIWGNILYLSRKGEAEVYLYRNKLREVKVAKSASGHLESGDKLILATPGLLRGEKIEKIEEEVRAGGLEKFGARVKENKGSSLVIDLKEEEDLGEEENILLINADKLFPPDKKSVRNYLPSMLQKLKKQVFQLALLLLGFCRTLFTSVFRIIGGRKRKTGAFAFSETRRSFKLGLPHLLIFLLLTLFLSISWGIYSRSSTQTSNKFNTQFQSIEHKLAEAESLYTLNPIRAKDLLLQVQNDFEDLKKLKKEDKRLSELETKITTAKERINSIYRVENLPVFYDLSAFNKNVKAIDVEMTSSGQVILDESGAVYLLDTRNKEAKVLLEEQESRAKRLTINGNWLYVLTDAGVTRFNYLEESSPKKVIERDSSWDEVADIAFWGGNLYLLDKGRESILKYISVGEDFNKSIFAKEQSFRESNSLSIDGNVWVLNKDGVSRYLRGKREEFIIRGLDKAFKDAWEIKTTEASTDLFILDRGNSRVVVLDKAGVYQAVYETSLIQSVVSIVVDEVKKQILFLTSGKIYQMELK